MGAIGLLVHRLTRAGGGTVIGRPVEDPFTDVDFRPASPLWSWSETRKYARGVVELLKPLRPALVEVHNRPEIALILARSFPKITLFLHNDPQGMRGAVTAAQRMILLQRLSRVVTVSEHLRDRFLEGAPGDVTVMPNSIDVPDRTHRIRDKLILFVGRVVADKGADAFVEACAAVLPQLPGWRAEMVGADRFSAASPPTNFTRRLIARAQQVGVAMPGYLPHDATMERMSRAAIAVVPSRWPEPFGLSALEAMAHGAALVCSRRGALPEVAGDCAVYADPDKPGAIAAAVMTLATDTSRRMALVTDARIRAGRFDTAVAAAQLRQLRAELVGR